MAQSGHACTGLFAKLDHGPTSRLKLVPKNSRRPAHSLRAHSLEEEMMQRTVRFSAIAAITGLISVAILISATNSNVAQAQSTKGRAAALACGQELKKQCSGVPMGVPFGVPVQPTNVLLCLQKNQAELPTRCRALANNVVRRCDRDAARLCQGVVAGQGNILGCLTTARRSVSSRCNAALDAAFLRQ